MLNKALLIAYNAHKGQFDNGGNPYILHPMTVALNVETEDEKIVALLHDVVEDTEISVEDLRKEGFSENVVDAVEILTKKDSENYERYLSKVKKNDLARKVKMADLKHNSDLSRLKSVTQKDIERINKYKKALEYLR